MNNYEENFMKPVALILIFIFCSHPLMAERSKLEALEQEISRLQEQKQQLRNEIKTEEHEEMELEMRSQKEFIEYDWSGMSNTLKHAQEAEHDAQFKKAKIHAIDSLIEKLIDEKETLLQK